MISTSGSGQMLPLPMNEYLQDNLKQACGVEVEFDAVDFAVLWATPDRSAFRGAMALNFSSPTSDAGVMARYFFSGNFSQGFNFGHWKDDKFDAALAMLADATDAGTIDASYRTAHERLVDNPPWLYIIHDLNPRAMSKTVKGFISAQSWFLDLTLVGRH
jgi:peptide/nickel transport system substrate-binding protein